MAFFSLSLVSAGTCPNGIGVCDETIPFQGALIGQIFNNATAFVNNSVYWQGYTPQSYDTSFIYGQYVPYTGALFDLSLGSKSISTSNYGVINNLVSNYSYFGDTSSNYYITISKDAGISITPRGNFLFPYGLTYTDGNFSGYIGYSRTWASYFASSLAGTPSIYLAGLGKAFQGTGNGSITGRMTASDGYDDGTILIHDGTITGGIDATFSGTGTFGTLRAGNICYSNGTNCNTTLFGWQPNDTTENRNYNTTGNVSVHDLSVSGKANITENLQVQNNLFVTKNATLTGLTAVGGVTPNQDYQLYVGAGSSTRIGLFAYTIYTGSNQMMTGAYTQVYGSSSNANPRAYGGFFQAYNYGTTMRNLASGKSSTTVGGVFNSADRFNVSYGPNGTHFFQGGWFYASTNGGNWTSNPAVVLQDGVFGTSGFNESAWGTNAEHYSIYAYPAKNGIELTSNNVVTTGNITSHYKSSDGSVGVTASGTSCTITAIKDGIITGASCT